MAVSVVMPALEMAQETGKLLSWFKKEGEPVAKGERLLEIETDKIVVELEAPADGVLAGVRSHEGAVVPVGQTIAWIVAPGEQVPAEAETAAARAVTAAARAVTVAAPAERAAPATTVSATPAESGPRISPKARRLAEQQGVDITKIKGTGPGGTISSEDVQAAADAMPEPLSAVARLMAKRTTESWTQAPHFFLVRDVDATGLRAARERLGARHTVTDLLVALTARALTRHPKMNASWTGAAIQLNPSVSISLAVAVKDGVVGAVIHDADRLAVSEIAAQRKDLAERARAGLLRPHDISGGTFTISNLGMYGVDAFSAILTPPQTATLAVGRIADRVVAVEGAPAIRPMLTMTLSSDHRVVDGAQAAWFLKDLAELLTAAEL
ncbi:MAG TPA: dihydrolipoamide acetyltransferase family protein [Bryobacteraceae bacterium]|jgi:pyruvate dehydrogenase E2 component (dihydrolipoamide acetyltransferase)